MKFMKNYEAVSPVVGVILMVLITVILAAVIAMFVFGMAGNINSGRVNVSVSKIANGDIVVTYNGGTQASSLKSLDVTINDVMQKNVLKDPSDANKPVPFGMMMAYSGYASRTGGDHVVVVGEMFGGARWVVANVYL